MRSLQLPGYGLPHLSNTTGPTLDQDELLPLLRTRVLSVS